MMLTKLQIDILSCASNGRGSKQIAKELYYSYHWVRMNKRRILKELNAKNMSHAVAIAIREGIID